MYTLTKIKTFTGMEGQGLNATICRDGKPVAFVMDDAHGGPTHIDFHNPGQNPRSYEAAKTTWETEQQAALAWAATWYDNDPQAAASRALDAELDAAYPMKRTPEQRAWKALESWVNATVDAAREEAQLKRWSKTKTVFRLVGDKPGEYRTLNVPATRADVLPHLRKTYGEKLEMVYGVDLGAA